jgi:hypothetical protein
MFWSAQVPKEPDDDNIIVVGNKLTSTRLFDAEHKDRKTDMLHPDVVRPSQSLLSNEKSKIHKCFSQLSFRQRCELFIRP